jgi:glyoxylase-like metal-dependent hydrolase (beta-lactamase superfamily II)
MPLSRRAFASLLATPAFAQLPAGLTFREGPINSCLWRKGPHQLAIYNAPVRRADLLLLTHARRDLLMAATLQAPRVGPAASADLLANPLPQWRELLTTKRLHDYDNQLTRWPIQPTPLSQAVSGGDTVSWAGESLEVLASPGYTRDAVSYGFTHSGRRILATGALVYQGGRLLDLYSLQDAIPALQVRGYHGYAARAADLIASLRRILAWQPDLLIPSHGPLITQPARDIPRLIQLLEDLYANYLATDAYRWYFGSENYRARAARVVPQPAPAALAQASLNPQLPPWLRAVNNSRLLLAPNGEAILIDCGATQARDQVRAWHREGLFRKLTAIYVTHYHDDHTDFVHEMATEFQAAVWASDNQAAILREPHRFYLPCLTPNPIPTLTPLPDGHTFNWNSFTLSSFHFPGQTLYHGALLVRPPGEDPVFFIGDSFTPTGMDDYCLLNRNLVGHEQGLDYCLRLLDLFPDAWLVNQHVPPLFRFTAEQRDTLRRHLTRRRHLLSQLTPLPGANFAVDHQWFRLDPYVIHTQPRQPINIEAVITNHASAPHDFTVTIGNQSRTLRITPGQEARLPFRINPPSAPVITASLRFANWRFPQAAEALLQFQK